jgi:phosphonate transport system substrate-binding protein
MSARRSAWFISALVFISLACASVARAADWRFAVPPFLPAAEMRAQYQPLMDYLNASTGEHFELVTANSYQGYWADARKGGAYDLVLDNAPMIGFRIQRQGFTVLAKIAGVMSQSLITSEKTSILDPDEVIGRPVATVASPNMAALAMFQMFPNPMRQPDFIFSADPRAAVDAVLKGKALAAIVPTPIAIQFSNINVVVTTEQIPHLAIAASPNVPSAVQARVKQALLDASKNVLGQKALSQLNTTGFESTSNATYSGYADMLKGTFGY